MIFKPRPIDRRIRVGAVNPTKMKSDRNVINEPANLVWVDSEYITKVFNKYAIEIDRLKNVRRDRLKKRKYKGLELTNTFLHFWAVNNYNERIKEERLKNEQLDYIRIKVVKNGSLKENTKIDFNHKQKELTPDLIELQFSLNAKRLKDYQTARTKSDKAKIQKVITDFYDKERLKLVGFKPTDGQKKLTISIDNFDFDFDL